MNLKSLKDNLSKEVITSFKGEYRFLSNYWPVQVAYEGMDYPSVEQAYKAQKTTDMPARIEIQKLEANKKGLEEKIENIIERAGLRRDWTDELRLKIMRELLMQKFNGRDPELRRELINTNGHDLIEGNDWGDVFFGVCDGVGENHLGKILMEIRSVITIN